MSTEEIPSIKDALNEYFRLKEKFENEMNVNKRKIINNPTLSKREKRAEYLKLMPKCVNCKRPSRKGTIFSITFNPSNDKDDSYRVFKSQCGNLADPCNLNIEINLGSFENLDKSIADIKNEIDDAKKNIISDKNKLLFGLITTESALKNFDNNKSYINDLTSIYESYISSWNKINDNPDKKAELDEALVQSYENINIIKDCIKKMNQTNDSHFATEAATIYHTTLQPLLNKIRQLKYGLNLVYNDNSNYTCRLIQRKNALENTYIGGYNNTKVVAFDVGLKAFNKKPNAFIIESDSTSPEQEFGQKELTIKIQEPGQPKPIGEIDDEPIIGQGVDGIDWQTKEYKDLWIKLPQTLRNEFKSNIDWMKEFMYKCVNERINHGPQWNGCKLTIPPNIVIPPRKMENGQYDFGVSIYNKVFSKLPESLKNTYLTFYNEDMQTKEKNYNMLIDAMNDLVEKELNFGRGFF
jgi:hypothetical protein